MIRHVLSMCIAVSLVALLSGCTDTLCDKRLQEACYGCNPHLERLRVTVMNLNKTLITEVKRCADATVNGSYKDSELAAASFNGCISSSLKIDEKSRDVLLKEIEKVPIPTRDYEVWFACYERVMTPAQKPVVVVLDSHNKGVVYCKHTQDIGGSNADDIISLLKDMPVSIATVSTHLEWNDDQRVIGLTPALIVIHASAFYKETKEMDGNTRLLNLLDSLKNTESKILVYTRGLPDQASSDIKTRWVKLLAKLDEPKLKQRTQLFIMPKGHDSCFDDPDIGVPFKNKVRDMLSIGG